MSFLKKSSFWLGLFLILWLSVGLASEWMWYDKVLFDMAPNGRWVVMWKDNRYDIWDVYDNSVGSRWSDNRCSNIYKLKVATHGGVGIGSLKWIWFLCLRSYETGKDKVIINGKTRGVRWGDDRITKFEMSSYDSDTFGYAFISNGKSYVYTLRNTWEVENILGKNTSYIELASNWRGFGRLSFNWSSWKWDVWWVKIAYKNGWLYSEKNEWGQHVKPFIYKVGNDSKKYLYVYGEDGQKHVVYNGVDYGPFEDIANGGYKGLYDMSEDWNWVVFLTHKNGREMLYIKTKKDKKAYKIPVLLNFENLSSSMEFNTGTIITVGVIPGGNWYAYVYNPQDSALTLHVLYQDSQGNNHGIHQRLQLPCIVEGNLKISSDSKKIWFICRQWQKKTVIVWERDSVNGKFKFKFMDEAVKSILANNNRPNPALPNNNSNVYEPNNNWGSFFENTSFAASNEQSALDSNYYQSLLDYYESLILSKWGGEGRVIIDKINKKIDAMSDAKLKRVINQISIFKTEGALILGYVKYLPILEYIEARAQKELLERNQ